METEARHRRLDRERLRCGLSAVNVLSLYTLLGSASAFTRVERRVEESKVVVEE